MENVLSKLWLVLTVAILLFTSAACTPQDHTKANTQIHQTGQVISEMGTQLGNYARAFVTNTTARQETLLQTADKISEAVRNAGLKQIHLDDIHSYQAYKDFIENVDLMIKTLNEQAGLNIQTLSESREAHAKVIGTIEKYSPLIDNYDQVVSSSYIYASKRDVPTATELVTATTGLAFETAFLEGNIAHQEIFEALGLLSGKSGVLHLARTCPSCVSVIMNSAYWTARKAAARESTKMVEAGVNATISNSVK